MSSESDGELDRDYRFDVSVVMGTEPYNGGRVDWLRPQRWSSMLAAYWARRFTDREWGQWIDSVNNQWPVTFSHKSALLRKTNGSHAYEYGQEFSVGVDAPSWIQARKYVDACLKPVLADHYTIHPPNQEERVSKISEELARLAGDFESDQEDYEPSYPEIQFGASGRDETVGIVRLDVADSQVEAIVSQAREAVQDENPGLFSPHIPLRSKSAGEELTEATEQIHDGEAVFANINLTGDDGDSEPPTVSLVFVLSESGARRLGNAVETSDTPESESPDTGKTLVHPELIKDHTEQLIKLTSTALETNGRGVVGSIPDNDDEPVDLDWVRDQGPPDPSIELLGFRAEYGEETVSTGKPVFGVEENNDAEQEDNESEDDGQGSSEREEGKHAGGEQEHEKEEETEGGDRQESTQYRISVELAADAVLSERFDASYVSDVPANSFKNDGAGLHIPNPEICLFVDVALDANKEEELSQNLDKIDITNKTAEIAVFKAPLEPDSIHQELIVEIFPHFKLLGLREELRPLIEDVGGRIRTEELPYFVKYSMEEPYYITHDVSSLTNPERSLTDSENYYNQRRIELMHTHTDYRRTVSGEKLTLSLSEVKTGAES